MEMLVIIARIILCFFTVVFFAVSGIIYEENYERTRTSKRALTLGIISGLVFSLLLVITNWNVFAIPKIILLFAVSVFFCIDEDDAEKYGSICIIAIVVAYVIAGIIFLKPEVIS